MANWVKLTKNGGQPVLVNLDEARAIKARGTGATVVFFGDEDQDIDVMEAIDELVPALNGVQGKWGR